jgi:SAM-dependent methyltransferase
MTSQYDFYANQYRRFAGEIATEIRREVFGEDIGQTGWRTLEEHERIAELVREEVATNVLDVACGSGGPTLDLAKRTGCRLTGVDIEQEGIAQARRAAVERKLETMVRFEVTNCNQPLPFGPDSFDIVVCVDAITHLADRFAALADWARILRPGGRVVFTDAVVLTGPVSREDLDIRASQGPFFVVPPGTNEEASAAAGLAMRSREDTTDAVTAIATGLLAARERRAGKLIESEGADWFAARQRFLEATGNLARKKRLSRFYYVAEKTRT